jgi:hypothetical protein
VIKVATIVSRAPGVTTDEFRERYEAVGVPAAFDSSPAMQQFARNYVLSSLNPAGWTPNVDAVFFTWFADRQAAERAAGELEFLGSAESGGRAASLIGSSSSFLVDECESTMPQPDRPVARKLILLVGRRDTLTPPEFKERYETGHAVLARKIMAPNIVRYSRNHVVAPLGADASPDFDVVTEFWFEPQDPASGLSDAEIRYLVRDEEVFMDRSSMRTLAVDERLSDSSR